MIQDLTGSKFGKWTVISRDMDKHNTYDVRWICKCECGTIKSVLGKYLRNGKTTSCGCSKKIDLKGKRYGKLVVLETIHNYNGRKRAVHKCRCDCGNTIIINTPTILQESCGCTRRCDSIVGNKYGMLLVKEMLYNYKNAGITYCKCKCECGKEIIIRADALKSGNSKSCGCVHSPSLLGKKFGRLLVVDEVINDTSQRKWKCKCDCGSETIVTSYLLTSGQTKSCGCLRSENVSSNEILIGNILKENGINFQKEKSFDSCKSVKKLRFDFYLPDYNTCIEYDGLQHFKPIAYFGGEESFNNTKKNDSIKNKYCQDNGISLIRIPYTYSDTQIKDTIKSIIQNPVTTTVI